MWTKEERLDHGADWVREIADYLLNEAEGSSVNSDDPVSQFGAVIAPDSPLADQTRLVRGWNHAIPRVMDRELMNWTRDGINGGATKYDLVLHAEEHALQQHSRRLLPPRRAMIAINGTPCPNCVRMLAADGITGILYRAKVATRYPEDWFPRVKDICRRAGMFLWRQQENGRLYDMLSKEYAV